MSINFIIPVHSFVDVITNSSSEIFIASGQKSVDTLKRAILIAASEWNDNLDLNDDGYDWNLVSLDGLWTTVFAEPVLLEYNISMDRIGQYFAGMRAMQQTPEYKTAIAACAWGKPAALAEPILSNFIGDILEDNGCPLTDLHKFPENLAGQWDHPMYAQIFTAIGNNTPVRKGDIVVRSATDNSVPPAFVEHLRDDVFSVSYYNSHC